VNLIGDCVFLPDVRGTLAVDPSLRHGAFDDMALDPFAMRASKRSQIVAGVAGLDCRQLHRRAASRALRTLVLDVQHWRSLSLAL
jgi:hypothetical protein